MEKLVGVAIRGSLDLVGVRFPFQPRLLHESRRGVFSHIADSLLHLPPGPSPSVGTGVSNVWLVTCKDSISWRSIRLPLSIASLA